MSCLIQTYVTTNVWILNRYMKQKAEATSEKVEILSMEMTSRVSLLFLYLHSFRHPDGGTRPGLYLMRRAAVWYLDS